MIAWLGTVASIIGSFAVSLHYFTLGYCFFLVGGVSWLYVGWIKKDKALMTLNGVFFIANLIGLYNA